MATSLEIGAGKTTTMGMLTGEFPPTSGDAFLAGVSVTKDPQKIRRRIGYCPQFDAHFPNLTGREHVELYASIKGIPESDVADAAGRKLREVGLSKADSDRLSSEYSGGMKRRLSLACATIGQPQIIFLDECSTGVDPVARRDIWKLISDMALARGLPQSSRPAVVLTTHSMDECEALCPRMGIMANGRLRCIGSAQHLKNKFGKGLQIELSVNIVNMDDEDYTSILDTFERSKPWCADDMEVQGELTFDLEESKGALRRITSDESLTFLISGESGPGYMVWKDASSPVGVSITNLAEFAAAELRLKAVQSFMSEFFTKHELRERQDMKARYEVDGERIKISNVFALIEAKKDILRISDYSVSQTSLEQVFNMHAEEAERRK
jgi:ATP-binding cassette, subfamily A (ABC1), member 3